MMSKQTEELWFSIFKVATIISLILIVLAFVAIPLYPPAGEILGMAGGALISVTGIVFSIFALVTV